MSHQGSVSICHLVSLLCCPGGLWVTGRAVSGRVTFDFCCDLLIEAPGEEGRSSSVPSPRLAVQKRQNVGCQPWNLTIRKRHHDFIRLHLCLGSNTDAQNLTDDSRCCSESTTKCSDHRWTSLRKSDPCVNELIS